MSGFRWHEFLRFCLVGAGSALVGMALLAFLTEFVGLNYLLAYVVSFLAVNAFAYAAARHFAFARAREPARTGLLRYYGVSGASLATNAGLMYVAVSLLGFWYLGSALVLTVLNAPVNYLVHRRVSFGLHRSCD